MTTDQATKELIRLHAEALKATADALLAWVDSSGHMTRYYGISEYAQLTGKSESTIRRRLEAQKLPGARKTGGRWVIPVEDAS